MASPQRTIEEVAQLAVRQKVHAPQTLKHNPPWRRVLIRFLRKDQSLKSVYRLMGMTTSRRYWLARDGGMDLRLSVASQMALAVGAPLGRFLEALAKEHGIPPLRGQAPLQKRRKCRSCGKLSHPTMNCPLLRSRSDMRLLLARGEAAAAKSRRSR
jgi:hypothetical protein